MNLELVGSEKGGEGQALSAAGKGKKIQLSDINISQLKGRWWTRDRVLFSKLCSKTIAAYIH